MKQIWVILLSVAAGCGTDKKEATTEAAATPEMMDWRTWATGTWVAEKDGRTRELEFTEDFRRLTSALPMPIGITYNYESIINVTLPGADYPTMSLTGTVTSSRQKIGDADWADFTPTGYPKVGEFATVQLRRSGDNLFVGTIEEPFVRQD